MLDDTAIERFARQIVVPGVGAEGQERICSSRVAIIGEPAGVVLAATYARAAGFLVSSQPEKTPACVLVAGTRSLSSRSLDDLRAFDVAILWYRLNERSIVGGAIAAGGALDPLSCADGESAQPDSRHALAAADLVGAAVGFVLGWSDVEPAYSLDFT